jgi:hypothetical protein
MIVSVMTPQYGQTWVLLIVFVTWMRCQGIGALVEVEGGERDEHI